jgi:hypothetical protein
VTWRLWQDERKVIVTEWARVISGICRYAQVHPLSGEDVALRAIREMVADHLEKPKHERASA